MALEYLQKTADQFAACLRGLSEGQWRFKPAADRWSIAECAEHIVVTETIVLDRIQNALRSQPSEPDPGANTSNHDDVILGRILSREQRFVGPPAVMPTNRWLTMAEVIEQFHRARAASMEALRNAGDALRSRFVLHPVAGNMDAYQWFLSIAAHTERHLDQIEEIKSHPDYPASGPGPVTIEALNHISRTTTRLEDARRFYVDVLGFREISRPAFQFAGAWLYGYRMQIHLIENPAAPSPPPGIDTRGNHIAFAVPDVDAMERRLQEHGLEYQRKLIADRGIHQLFFRDPDGHLIELGKYGQIDV